MARTQAGIDRAKARGQRFGRRPKLNSRQRAMIAERRAKGMTFEAIAEEFGVGVATIYRAVAKAP